MEALLLVVLIVVLYIYISKTNKLSRRVNEIERGIYDQTNALGRAAAQLELEMRKLKGSVDQPRSTVEVPPALAPPPRETKTEVPPAPLPPPQIEATPPLTPPVVSPLEPLPPPPTPPPARPSRTRAEWEALIGGKLLNRIGALALIIGVGFFLKYAFDNNWFPEWVRVLIGFAIGGLLLLLGARSHKKGFQIFAQGLVGAGIAILYLSVYASFNFYRLVSQPVALVMMSAVTVLAFFQAFKYDSRAVSLLGWAGGFLTPFLLSTGQVNEIGLFTYIVLLDIGLLAVVVKKDAWIVLEPLTLVATYLVYLIWNESYYTPDKLLVALFFLSIFWGLFYALDVFRAMRAITTFAKVRHVVAALNAIFYIAFVYDLINPPYPRWAGAVTLAIGAVYAATALAIKRRQPEKVMVLARYALTAIGMLVLATAFQFSDFVTVACWSAEALILVWCGVHWQQRHVWQVALGLFGLAFLFLFSREGVLESVPIEDFKPIFNLRALAFIVLTAALGASAVLSNRLDGKSRVLIQAILRYGWCFLLFTLATVETRDYFEKALRLADQTFNSTEITRLRNLQQLTLSGVWLLYSIGLMMVGIWRRTAALRMMAMVLFGIIILKIFIYDLSFLETLYRIFSFIGLGLILLAVSYLYQRYRAVIFGEAVKVED